MTAHVVASATPSPTKLARGMYAHASGFACICVALWACVQELPEAKPLIPSVEALEDLMEVIRFVFQLGSAVKVGAFLVTCYLACGMVVWLIPYTLATWYMGCSPASPRPTVGFETWHEGSPWHLGCVRPTLCGRVGGLRRQWCLLNLQTRDKTWSAQKSFGLARSRGQSLCGVSLTLCFWMLYADDLRVGLWRGVLLSTICIAPLFATLVPVRGVVLRRSPDGLALRSSSLRTMRAELVRVLHAV